MLQKMNEINERKSDSLVWRALNYLRNRKEKVENGGINTIPSPFIRFSSDFIGIEQGKYYLVTGQTKAGKSQITAFIFLYNVLMYAYKHPDKIRVKIFYFPLEETPQEILYRFMSWYLYVKSSFKIEVSPEDLKSSKPDTSISEDILNLLESEDYLKIFEFFESHVTFSSTRNPTGMYNEVKAFMEDNGTIHYKKALIKDPLGNQKEVDSFDWYEPNDPDLYVLTIKDHISLATPEKIYGTNQVMTLKQTIDKDSEYNVLLRNRYNVIPVVVQQQNVESESNDSIKLGRIRPTIGNLSDSKYTSKDANVILGIFSPFRFELSEYLGYNIKILRDNFRLLEVIINRGGSPGGTIGLYFNGKCNYFKELPPPNNSKMQDVYSYFTRKLKGESNSSMTFFTYNINNKSKKLHRWKIFSKFVALFKSK